MKSLKLLTCVLKPLAATGARVVVLAAGSLASTTLVASELRWEKLSSIPNALGVAGAFAGVSGDALLIAGGANFPEKKPWEGGSKVWHHEVYVLENPDGAWQSAGRLPLPLGYGVAVSHKRGVVCFGGSTPTRHHGSAIVMRWKKGQLETELLLGMPKPRANLCGALVGNTAYLFGGTATPDATNAVNTLFAMNLSPKRPGWRVLEPLPAAGRILATAGAHDGSLYIFGGAALHPGSDGKVIREWLREAWRYTPGKGWKRLADLPRVAVAAPSPAPVINGKLILIGGDDGSQVNALPNQHQGFRHDVLAYDPKTDRWEDLGDAPFAHVTTTTVVWKNKIVIPSGEVKPGIRSPEVWSSSAPTVAR
jgi:N-acetylneuraminate epimerase